MEHYKKYKKIKYIYPKKRDAVLILGAGASYPDGVPLQSEIIPIILSEKYPEIKKSTIGKNVINFINNNFSYSFKNNIFPKLEDLFAYIDFFLNQKINQDGEYTNEKFIELKESLIKLIYYVISRYSRETWDDYKKLKKRYYRIFWELINKINKNISIITFNYDTLLEESFDFLYPDYGAIDYCINLMNYDNLSGEEFSNWWDNPRVELTVWENSKPVSIKIMKIHGSLNWKYCKTCSKILLTPWDTDIDLNSGSFIKQDYQFNESEIYRCPLDRTILRTMIIQPAYMKNFDNPDILKIFNEAIFEIKSTEKVIFIGYSFPDSDIHVRAILNQAFVKNKKISIIDINNSKKFYDRYRLIKKNIDFYQISFEELLSNQKLFRDFIK